VGSSFVGGPVKQATIGLFGEAGAELVIPNWLYSDPKQANLMGFLEATIASRGNAFATGGSTTGVSGVMGADSLDRWGATCRPDAAACKKPAGISRRA
jgi:hypothetical protein